MEGKNSVTRCGFSVSRSYLPDPNIDVDFRIEFFSKFVTDAHQSVSIPDKNRIRRIVVWLFWRDKAYPFNYIGRGAKGVAEKLGISELEAYQLLIAKIEERLPTIEDIALKKALEDRIQYYLYWCRRINNAKRRKF